MFIFSISEKEGWFYTPQFSVYQKVNKGVYCYISHYIGFYTLQLYERGTISLCTLEARSKGDIEGLFELGEKWLSDYQDFNKEDIIKDKYHISQPTWKENCWV